MLALTGAILPNVRECISRRLFPSRLLSLRASSSVHILLFSYLLRVFILHRCWRWPDGTHRSLTSQSECQETKIQPAVASFLTGFVTTQVGPDYAYLGSLVVSMANRVYSINSCKALGGGGILLNFDGLLRADAAEHDEWAELVDDKRWSYKVLKAWYRRPRLGIKTCP